MQPYDQNMPRFGTPLSSSAVRVLILGSGELGKELVIELQRLGAEVIACDRYVGAPAMQVAHRHYTFDMLDPMELRRVVLAEQPHIIVPEIEAIATEELLRIEQQGFCVVPTAEAVKLTMDREGIRRLAAEELQIPTANYRFADDYNELVAAASEIGFPCVVKPIMSSSGKGQSIVRSKADLLASWEVSQSGGRTGAGRVIVEEFVKFESEITLLTIRSVVGTAFCDPIGHRQESGDYVESWQPHPVSDRQLTLAKGIAENLTNRLGGFGLFGIEFFLTADDGVLFSEVSPRPHDTGLVTLATQAQSEFALHARAILGLPVASVFRYSAGASAAIRCRKQIDEPVYEGVAKALSCPDIDIRIFGKPEGTDGRRLAVILARGEDAGAAVREACKARELVSIKEAAAMPAGLQDDGK